MTLFKKKTAKDYTIYSLIILIGIILDQLTKFLVTKYMSLYQSIPLIKGFLHLTYLTNDGAAFGSMDSPDQRWIFLVISSVAIIGFVAYLYLGHAENILYGVALSMVISGGIGNMIDRLGIGFYVNPNTGLGEVVDFIDFCGIWSAVFNGADSFVCVGAGLLILALIIDLKKEYALEKAKKAAALEATEGTEAPKAEEGTLPVAEAEEITEPAEEEAKAEE
ncbi:MAG: signal peptidase II [Clostridia bacterium]|nr:signal peptidase II [Clostridia bacterium]